MRYYSASAGDLSKLTVRQFWIRFAAFKTVHEQRLKFEAALAGAKLN